MEKKPTVAIIVPVFNEKEFVEGSLKHLISLKASEVIVVDGRSTDGTYEIIREKFPSVRCYQTVFPECSLQMNLGAIEARSEVFIFVHIDTRLPNNAVELVQEKITKGFIGGGFKKQYDQINTLLRVYLYFLNNFYLARMHCMVRQANPAGAK